MSWLAPELDKRIQIVKPVQSPNSISGGFNRSYETLLTIWGGLKPLEYVRSSTQYIRGVQTTNDITHTVKIRKCGVSSLGKAFSSAFSTGFDSIPDINSLKSDFFLFVQQRSTVKGRIFRVHNISNVREEGEYYSLQVEEIEEKGTGYTA